MKKVVFAALALTIGLWSCSQDDENKGSTPDGYVDVSLGTESGELKSIVTPGGATSWNMGDELKVLDIDGTVQTFNYDEATAKSSAKFKGTLKAATGTNVYRAYHAPENCNTTLENGNILVVKRTDVSISEDGVNANSETFGKHCPMVAIPFELDVNNQGATESIRFYHLGTMIEARVTLKEPEYSVYSGKYFDNVVFELESSSGTAPFYTETKLDLSQLTTSHMAEHLDDYITNFGDTSVKTNKMSTKMDMSQNRRTIGDLLEEYKTLGSFPIPIFALPTNDNFTFTGTVTFYDGNTVQLKMQGTSTGTSLKPTGLNVLNFDHEQIVP